MVVSLLVYSHEVDRYMRRMMVQHVSTTAILPDHNQRKMSTMGTANKDTGPSQDYVIIC